MTLRLWPDQQAFVDECVKHGDIVEAYRVAYSPPTDWPVGKVATEAWLVRETRAIKEAIKHRERLRDKARDFGVQDALGLFLELVEADPRELIGLRVGACRYCWGEGHAYHWRMREYQEALAELPDDAPLPPSGGFDYDHTARPNADCPECAGEGLQRLVPQDTDNLTPGAAKLYGGVKQTKDGLQILMADRMKALENVTRILGGFKDQANVKVSGAIGAMVGVVETMPDDPVKAAEMYREIVKGMSS